MNRDEHTCLLCNSSKLEEYPAKFAEFISKRVFDGQNKDLELYRCNNCGFAFYSYRFSDKETEKLYKDYRGKEYQELRQSCEPMYTVDFNNQLSNDFIGLDNRRNNIYNILSKNIKDISSINSVLDFGGDRGQLIVNLLSNANYYVYEISQPNVENDVKLITDWDKSDIKKFDLVVCAQVLEHVSSPVKILNTLKSHLNKDGYLYIEVPYYSPFNSSKIFNKILFKFNRLFKLNKNKIYCMHEHVNFFTIISLKNILNNMGFTVLEDNVVEINSSTGKNKIISVIAKLRN